MSASAIHLDLAKDSQKSVADCHLLMVLEDRTPAPQGIQYCMHRRLRLVFGQSLQIHDHNLAGSEMMLLSLPLRTVRSSSA